MRRFWRWAFNVVALLSLLLCLAAAVLWVRSCFVRDTFPKVIAHSGLAVQSLSGRLCVCSFHSAAPMSHVFALDVQDHNQSWPHPSQAQYQSRYPLMMYGWFQVLPPARLANGFGFGTVYEQIFSPAKRMTMRVVAIPYWFIVVVFIGPPLFWGWKRLRTRRALRLGHCLKCGYNLTGNVSGICPECGTAVQEIGSRQKAEGREMQGAE